MFIVRFKETFRERVTEWIQSFGMLGWGLITLLSPGLFEDRSFFSTLLLLMPQIEWAILAISVGIIRLTFLFINGAWRPSAHIRALGCLMGSLLWGALLISTLSIEYLTPAIVTYSILLSSDIISLWFAAGDAKLADLTAKGYK